MTRKLKQSLVKQKQQNKQVVQQITGILGLPLNGQRRVEVSNRNSYVYVRLRNNESEVIEAFNNKVAPAYNLPVIVERQGNRYVVVSVDTQRYENNWNSFAPFLPRHGNTHSFNPEGGGGGDIVWVYSPQFVPLLAQPSGSLGAPNVFINAYTLKNSDGTWKYVGNTGTQNLTPYNPTSPTGAVIVLVYVDSVSGNPGFLVGSGTMFSNSITGANQITPYIPAITNPDWIPDVAVRLITGTSQISWNNLYDVRQWLHPTPSGSGAGGLSSVSVQDEGIVKGSVTTFNFVGSPVDVSVSGSVARVFVTGSASAASDATYLRLDTSNDPLYGGLILSGSFWVVDDSSYALFKRLEYGEGGESDTVVEIDQLAVTNGLVENPALYIFRGINNAETPTFTGPAIKTDIVVGSGIVKGGVLLGKVEGIDRVELNPNATGTPYLFDTASNRPTGTKLASFRDFGTEKMYVAEDGTVNISTGTYNIGGTPHTHGAETPAMVLISGAYLNADAATIDFPSIPTGTYKDLKLILSVRSDRASQTSDKINMRVNNLSTSGSYSSYISAHNHSGVESSEEFLVNTVTQLPIGYATAATAPASQFGEYEITIVDYADTNKFKSMQIRGGGRYATTTGNIQLFDGLAEFLSATAITRLTFSPFFGSNFKQFSSIRLYGII